jgi:cobalt-precorrin 5A hydrolase/precorrin-3B C17-methyltransferase
MTGTLYGLGIGPGDPELITLKARDILARVPVIAYPAPEGGQSLVRAIAERHVPAGCEEIVIATPMCADRFPAQEVYDRVAGAIASHLKGGRDVAVLCEGDPFLYGSFMYVFERLHRHYPTRVVPGVSSLTAVAAAAGMPLGERDDTLVVLPATLPEAALAARLARAEAAVIMKVGRHVAKVCRVLEGLGLAGDAVYVERATMADERILTLDAAPRHGAPYFSAIVVRRHGAGHPRLPATLAVPAGVALVALSGEALALARRLQAALPGSIVHGLAGRAARADVPFAETALHLQALFAAGTPIAGICAAGILIRALAPLLADKTREPAVVAVASDGSAAVPLLGGHHGANRLARAIAARTGGIAALTTPSDLGLGLALDDPPPGWRVGNPEAAKPVAAALLAGEPVAIAAEALDAGWLARALADGGGRVATEARHVIRLTDRVEPAAPETLVLHPPVLAVGVGCARGAATEALIGLVEACLAEAGLATEAVACVASIDVKMDEPAVHAVAARLRVPARFFPAAELEALTPRLASPSEAVFAAVGCHGVAEAAALAAAGPDGRLVVAKSKTADATCAIARATQPIATDSVGRAQGRLAIVGIGPGTAGLRAPDATDALATATDVVGYRLYLDLLGALIDGKVQHAPPMTEEEARARIALDLAAEGRRVALVGSGDAGVYGLAALVFELLDREDRPAWNRIAIEVIPGITALAAAAARIGAPIGHDFCAISLSDLLTPWAAIERRLVAAAEGDFVVALYNPVSQRRRAQIARAREILLGGRPADTPVVLARNLGRPGEAVRVIRLADLGADDADMLTLVLVGSSATRRIDRGGRVWVYTPRGYAAKRVAVAGDAVP